MSALAADPPLVSFITTCKGRLAHLKQMLPAITGQDDSEVVVVDYDCPDGTAQWVRENHPECVVVAVTGKPVFQVTHARSLGLEAARGRWLFFIDADVILAPGSVARMQGKLSDRHFYVLEKYRQLGAYGSALISRTALQKVGGWDLQYVGYGAEDHDMYRRLGYAGYAMGMLRGEPAHIVSHSNEERTRHLQITRRQSLTVGRLYGEAKRELIKTYRNHTLRPELLAQLRAQCERAIAQAVQEQRPTVSIALELAPEPALFPEEESGRRKVRKKLVIEMDLS